MTTVFEYLKIEGMKDCVSPKNYKCTGIKCDECRFQREVPRDGNLMVAAIKKMESIVDEDGVSNMVDFENYAVKQIDRNETYYTVWLFGDPANFFKLMQEAIDKGVIG
jgi:hypothetical protein